MSSFKGKTAFVSGGTRGIGLAVARRLATDGADVMVASSDPGNVDAAVGALGAESPSRVEGHAEDLRTLGGCEAAFQAHEKAFGACDILVHSAGATRGGVFPDQADDDFIDGFALKFHAGVRLSRLFWPMLKAARGNVVMIIGGAARTPNRTFMVGGAVNSALANFSKALADQGLADDVNVNWINPGQTETERLQTLLETQAGIDGKTVDQIREERLGKEGIRRLGQPEDTAALVAFLCGDEARHVNGVGIGVDGGATKGCF